MARYQRILLVFPRFHSDTGSSRPSPSIGYLAQALEDAGIEYDVLDMMLGYKFEDLIEKVDLFKPDLIGFTVFTLKHKGVFDIIQRLRKARPQPRIIVGGPHISVAREKALIECDSIDYACVHEGEELMIELCSGKDPEQIKGLIYRENGGICSSPLRPFEPDLSKFHFPGLNRFEINKYANEILIVSSRGCPYNCIYCSVRLMLGRNVRVRPVSDVIDEIRYWYGRGRRVFNFIDDNFTFYKQRVYEFCDALEKETFKGLILRASNGVRADRLDYELLRRMKQVGFRSIGIGVESGSDKVLKILKKGETVSQIDAAIQNACALGYEVALFFVFGAPGETLEDVEKSIELALKYPVFKVDFYNLLPFPGTQLYDWVNEKNTWLGNPDELLNDSDKSVRFGSNLFFETDQLSAEDLTRIKSRVKQVMKTVERRYITRVLRKKTGILAYPLAMLASTDCVQKLYFNNNRFRKMAEKARYSLLNKV